ncbi:MAG: hypothetical protein BWY10_01050 [Chloroflexi bacterium ADurb.Bin180]|nr:MAG: hypothetical protein BWY10_01050 [Chloroflexi bacterium ADurb.Bin180]HNR97657.1 hypothetical protein [Anaerolineae bacterium]HOU24752.1 hypothetical protein [Anaerolineae bacterium]HQJ50562.1 hypothetical protein [Anaerolineae bacterium]
MAFSINSKLGDLIANEQAKAVLEKHLPGMSTHPQLAMAKGMTLKMIAAFPQAGLSPDKLKAIDEDLQKIA